MAPPLKSMDFYVWLYGETWLIELKDPDGAAHDPHGQGVGMLKEIMNDGLLKTHLLPKLYGAYVHLHLEGVEPRGPVRYGVLIGLTTLTNADRSFLTDRLRRIIARVGPRVRHSRHWPEPEVHHVASWNAAHPDMPVMRHP